MGTFFSKELIQEMEEIVFKKKKEQSDKLIEEENIKKINELNKQKYKEEKEFELLKNKIEEQTKIKIPIRNNHIIKGGTWHNRISNFVVLYFKSKGFDVKTEKPLTLSNRKIYVVDVFAEKDNKKIVIECGYVSNKKLKDLQKRYITIHISYSLFNKILEVQSFSKNLNEVTENGM